MRLLIISSEFPPGPGGIGSHAYHVAHHLHNLGWGIRVVSPQDYASQAEVARFNSEQPFPVEKLSSGRSPVIEVLSRWRILLKQIRLHRPDLLLATGRSAVTLAALAKCILGVKLAVVGHGKEFGAPNFWHRQLIRWAYQQADAIVAVSHFTSTLIKRLGILPKRSTVIQNGADHQQFNKLEEHVKQVFRNKSGLDKKHVLMTVGSVTDRKGQEVVIRALPEILKEFPTTHYLMAGLPMEQPKLQTLAETLRVADHVHFLGRLSSNDLVGYLNCCDVFLMTSRFTEDGDCEGFGIAAVEAAMCGKPAIVTRNSGLIEAILDGKTGIGVPEGDSSAVAQAVVRLLGDVTLQQRMSAAAYSYSRDQQTWEKKGFEYDCFLRDLLAPAASKI